MNASTGADAEPRMSALEKSIGSSSGTLHRFCQVASINDENLLEKTIDWLLPVVMYYDDGPWRASSDWQEAIQREFDLEIGLHDIAESLQRLTIQGKLTYRTYQGEFSLSKPYSAELTERIALADRLESRVLDRWILDVNSQFSDISSEELREVILTYAAAAFREHGSVALNLLTVNGSDEVEAADNVKILQRVVKGLKISPEKTEPLSIAVDKFFQSDDPETIEFVAQLADSTFNLLAVASDENVQQELVASLPDLRMFLDTNVLLAIMGAQENTASRASLDIVRDIQENKLPVKLYCHEKTFREMENVLGSILDKICAHRVYAQGVSQAIVQMPWRQLKMSSIELEFHKRNSISQLSPDVYRARFAAPREILKGFGIEIYRESANQDSHERSVARSTIIRDYEEFLKKNPRRASAKYEALDHDARLWLKATELQSSSHSRRGSLHAGSLILSADSQFARFDRTVLRKQWGNARSVVVMPTAFLQAIRPFTVRGHLDDRAFARVFSTSEFRGLRNNSYSAVTSKVAQYISVYEDMPVAQATKILTDHILMEKLSKVSDDDAFEVEVANAVVATANAAVSEANVAKAGADESIGRLYEAYVRRLNGDISEAEYQQEVHFQFINSKFQFGDTVTKFKNVNSTVGVQGDHANVHGGVNQSSSGAENVSLVDELEKVKKALIAGGTAADFEALAGVQEAIEAAPREDNAGVRSGLRKAGQKALSVATALGVAVAAKAIEQSLGM